MYTHGYLSEMPCDDAGKLKLIFMSSSPSTINIDSVVLKADTCWDLTF